MLQEGWRATAACRCASALARTTLRWPRIAWRAAALSPFVGQRLTMVVSKETSADLERLGELVADGTVRPPLERTLPLGRAADAFALLEAGEVTGKVAVTVCAPSGDDG